MSMLSSFFMSVLIYHAKKNQGRDGARYFRSRTTFNFFQGFYYAERQNFDMTLHGPRGWCLATNAATSPSASGVLKASGWAGLHK